MPGESIIVCLACNCSDYMLTYPGGGAGLVPHAYNVQAGLSNLSACHVYPVEIAGFTELRTFISGINNKQ